MKYIITGTFLLIAELAVVAFLAYSFSSIYRKSGKTVTKKNLVYLVPTFIINYLLCLAASFFIGENVDTVYCASLIGETLGMFGFKFEIDLLRPLVTEYPIYCCDFVIAVLITASALLISIASIFGRTLANFVSKSKAMRRGGDIVLGDSPDALKYIENNRGCILWSEGMRSERFKALTSVGIAVMRAPLSAETLRRKTKGAHNVIVFRDSDKAYEQIISAFVESGALGADGLKLHLEAFGDEANVVAGLIENTDDKYSAYMSCFNKYELAARRFVTEYPISKFVPRGFYNANGTLANDKEINVVFLGFGKINYHLFRMAAMQFQFVKQKSGKLEPAPVHYHIFDNDGSRLNNELFSRLDYEFGYEFENTDFPPPDRICDLQKTRNADIYSIESRKFFRSCVHKNSFTYFVVSLENDFANTSCARTLERLFGDATEYMIFVRATDRPEGADPVDSRIIYFGEGRAMYRHASIVDDALSDRAQIINLLYSARSGDEEAAKLIGGLPTGEQYSAVEKAMHSPEFKRKAAADWAKLNDAQRYSNVYSALGIPFKLGLMGFAVCPAESGTVDEKEFRARYVNSGRDSDYADRTFYFGTETSNVVAFSEHSRWNAHYILSNYKQMKKCDIRVVNGKAVHKDDARRLHACITTYYGLDELITYKAELLEKDAKSRGEGFARKAVVDRLSDIYKYDYNALDGLYESAKLFGYGITSIDGVCGNSTES